MSETRQKIKVQICLGTVCFVLGAAELQTVVEEAPEYWHDIFDFTYAPCLETCNCRETAGAPPFITVDETVYSDMTYDKFYQLLASIVKERDFE